MEWYSFLVAFLGGLFVLLALKVPVGFAMLAVGIVGALYSFGSVDAALNQVSLSVFSSLNSFTFTAIPLFILMGDVLFRSGIAQAALDEFTQTFSRLPGGLAMVSVGGGAGFGVLSGSTLANTALFGKTLLPAMSARGYSDGLAVGSILASGGLAMVLPPSAVLILWGAIAQVPVGPLLVAGILPGILMAVGYGLIVFFWAKLRDGAPDESPAPRSISRALKEATRRLVGPGIIIVTVLGTIFLGIATPTESAAIGAVLAVVWAVMTRRMGLRGLINSGVSAASTSGMVFFILLGSNLYAQLMSFSGATRGFVSALTAGIDSPVVMLGIILFVLVVLGALIDQASIMLVTAPLFMPIVDVMGWDPIWFSILLLIALQIGSTTPPFGMSLFVIKGVAVHLSLKTIYRSVVPWIVSDLFVIVVLAIFPTIVVWLPSLM